MLKLCASKYCRLKKLYHSVLGEWTHRSNQNIAFDYSW